MLDADRGSFDEPFPPDDQRKIDPPIALPRSGPPMPLIIGLGIMLAAALFLFLQSHRLSLQDGDQSGVKQIALRAAPPPLQIPPDRGEMPLVTRNVVVVPRETPAPNQRPMPRPMPQPMYQPMPPQPQVFAPTSPMDGQRSEGARPNPGPALVIDLTNGTGASVNGSGGAAAAANGDESVRATLITSRASVIPQGSIIPVVLETPLNSDRPGLARAIVANDVRGFDGSRVLIPRGSRLIGEFKLDNKAGARRVLMTWTRLIRPDGVAIRIGSPATDASGGAGIPGSINTHFASRFFNAVLQTALTVAGSAAISNGNNGSNVLYVGIPGQVSQLGQQLLPEENRAPTVKVKGGAEIAVLVARDLDFSGTPAVR